MKLTILGAASPRFPLLLHSLLQRETLIFTRVHLYDIDTNKLELLARTILPRILAHHTSSLELIVAATLEEAVKDADYIFSSIRVGGQKARALDEKAALACDQIGQETVGLGGFALAMKTTPIVLEQVKVIQKFAPNAVLINFTNPSGLVTQAVHSLTDFKKIVGICDAPEMVADYTSAIYGCSNEEISLRYYGLNHLGWVYSIQVKGREMIDDLIDTKLSRFFEKEPFYRDLEEHIRKTRTIPNEYLYYYIHAQKVLKNQKQSAVTRAEVIEKLDAELYQRLSEENEDPITVFNRYMDARNSSYMTMESGADRSQPAFDLFHQERANGYDAIALNVLSSLLHPSDHTIILNIENNGFDQSLQDDDVIEVSSKAVDGWFIPVGDSEKIPAESKELLVRMKQYERKVIEAISSGEEKDAVAALSLHPFFHGNAQHVYACFKQMQRSMGDA
jgi:6-phospho-beta-glucosidase